MCPLTPAVHDLPVPEAVMDEARGKGKAPGVVYGGTCSLPKEAILEALANSMDLIYCPSTTGSMLHALIVSTFDINRSTLRPRPPTRRRLQTKRSQTSEKWWCRAVSARASLWSRALDGVAASERDGKTPAV